MRDSASEAQDTGGSHLYLVGAARAARPEVAKKTAGGRSSAGGPCPRCCCWSVLVADAEKEQQDDQEERRPEQPEKDEDHLSSASFIRSVWSGRSCVSAARPDGVQAGCDTGRPSSARRSTTSHR